MSVETATYISQLNPAYPAAGDPKSEGDDHLRVIKGALLGSFPNLGATAVTATAAQLNNAATKTGDTYTGTHNFSGATAVALPANTNIGSATPTVISYIINLTSDAQAQFNTKAPIASPAFTGVPTAPTATAGTNNTQIATTAFVQQASFSSVLPGQAGNSGKVLLTDGTSALWGLVSVAAVSGAAPLESPAFTGVPVAPTAAAGTNTTQVATTAFVTGGGTITGKVTGTVISEKSYLDAAVVNATATGAVALDLSQGCLFDVTLTSSVTLSVTNAPTLSGESLSFILRVRQGATPYAITWFSGITWLTSGSVAPSAGIANSITEYVFSSRSAGVYEGRVGAAT